MRITSFLKLFLFFVMSISNTQAVEVSVDMISGGGVDPLLYADIGTSFDVDIILGSTLGLAGFEFDLDFNSSMLVATAITSGNLLALPVLTLEKNISVGSIELAQATAIPFSGVDITSPSVLATVSFDIIGSGSDFLTLNNVFLTNSFSSSIIPVDLSHGELRVSAVPSPGVLVLMLSGIGLLRLQRKDYITG